MPKKHAVDLFKVHGVPMVSKKWSRLAPSSIECKFEDPPKTSYLLPEGRVDAIELQEKEAGKRSQKQEARSKKSENVRKTVASPSGGKPSNVIFKAIER